MKQISKKNLETIQLQNAVWQASGRSAEDEGIREIYQQAPRLPVVLVCRHIDKEINHGNILRIAECFRTEKVLFGNKSGRELDLSGSQGTNRWQAWDWCDPIAALRNLKQQGYRRYALHLTDAALPIDKVEWKFPMALALGEELKGFDEETLQECDECVAIPMFGLITSLNVAVATGICMNRIMEHYRIQNPDFLPVRQTSLKLINR